MGVYQLSRNAAGVLEVRDENGELVPATAIMILEPPVSGSTHISFVLTVQAHVDGSVYPHGIV